MRWVPALLLIAFCVPVAAQSLPTDAAAETTKPAPAHDAAQPDPAPPHPELLSTFQDFGGHAGLEALMEDFVDRLVADPRTHRFFADIDQVALKQHLVQQFCAVLGGGCIYTGRDMVEAHEAFGIDRSAFNALVEDLQLAMTARGIPFRSQNRLLAVLAPMHREIINR